MNQSKEETKTLIHNKPNIPVKNSPSTFLNFTTRNNRLKGIVNLTTTLNHQLAIEKPIPFTFINSHKELLSLTQAVNLGTKRPSEIEYSLRKNLVSRVNIDEKFTNLLMIADESNSRSTIRVMKDMRQASLVESKAKNHSLRKLRMKLGGEVLQNMITNGKNKCNKSHLIIASQLKKSNDVKSFGDTRNEKKHNDFLSDKNYWVPSNYKLGTILQKRISLNKTSDTYNEQFYNKAKTTLLESLNSICNDSERNHGIMRKIVECEDRSNSQLDLEIVKEQIKVSDGEKLFLFPQLKNEITFSPIKFSVHEPNFIPFH